VYYIKLLIFPAGL